MLNQGRTDLGIPNRINLTASRCNGSRDPNLLARGISHDKDLAVHAVRTMLATAKITLHAKAGRDHGQGVLPGRAAAHSLHQLPRSDGSWKTMLGESDWRPTRRW
jgi:hypothetical protein